MLTVRDIPEVATQQPTRPTLKAQQHPLAARKGRHPATQSGTLPRQHTPPRRAHTAADHPALTRPGGRRGRALAWSRQIPPSASARRCCLHQILHTPPHRPAPDFSWTLAVSSNCAACIRSAHATAALGTCSDLPPALNLRCL
jgi:hypothetical protein